MGNRPSASPRQGEAVSVLDILSLIVQDRMPITPMTLPSCLDQLVDWTDEATLTVNYLTRAGVIVLSTNKRSATEVAPVCFIPLVLTGNIADNVVTQRDIAHFPEDCTFERAAFYHQDIRIRVEPLYPIDSHTTTDAAQKNDFEMLSGLSFCTFLKLLRRLRQLVDLNDESLCSHQALAFDGNYKDTTNNEQSTHDECGICMARPQDTVLPCLHGVCSYCEARWVEAHMDCPFCRQPYRNQRRRHKNQWQMENWSKEDAEKDKNALEHQALSYWKKHASPEEAMASTSAAFTRLARSFNASSTDDGFVLLH